ncbi:ATP-dependent Clp protease ATP-binding subunit ClpX, partial [Corynebacterium diphtheriae]
IVAGAFAGLEKVIEERRGKKGIGFGAELTTKADTDAVDVFRDVLPEDLVKFGLIPEFIGRLPIVATVNNLDQASLVKVLTEPRNSLVKQYQRLFDMDRVDLEFDPEALQAIADLAIDRGTGARGLRAIMEELLVPVMYDIPDREDVAVVRINEAAVRGLHEPEMILHSQKNEEEKTA